MARLALAVAAITSLALASTTCAPPPAMPVPIVIDQFAFPPAPKTVRVGDAIAWTNNDVVDHTATGSRTEFDILIAPKSTVTMPVTQVGRIEYFCRLHPNMTGILEVTAR